MTWFSDIVDGVGDFFGGSSSTDAYSRGIQGPAMSDGSFSKPFSFGDSFIGRNWDDISKAINAGRQLYNAFDSNNARQGVRGDLLGVYQNAMMADAAYQQQLAAYNQQQSAAAGAARRRTEAARQQAAKKALKIQEKYLNQLASQYQPYADAAKMLTPKMADNYKQYLDTTSLLNAYLAPKVMEQMSKPPQAAYSIPIPQSAFSAPAIQSEAISFPTVEEMLNRRK